MNSKNTVTSGILRYLFPNVGTLLLMAFILFVYDAWAAPAQEQRAPVSPDAMPGVIAYQGTLLDASQQPVNDTVNITFRFYDDPSAGNLLWEEQQEVTVSGGLFNANLGSLNPISSTVWDADQVYLGIQVSGDSEMTPREIIGNVPYAMSVDRIPSKLLGYDSIDENVIVSESNLVNWQPVKGFNDQDYIEVTVQTHGIPVLVYMTARYQTSQSVNRYCAIFVYQGDTFVAVAHLDGGIGSYNWGCSGSYLFTELPAGTYTFRAMAWVNSETNIDWMWQRQIVVIEP